MRVRKQDNAGDMIFGGGLTSFWIDQPEAVAQAISTRLDLYLGTWFADTSQGVPWMTQVLGAGTTSTYDAVLRAEILGTPGANAMLAYNSAKVGRALTVTAKVNTIYGPTATVTSIF